jgi:nitrogen-specific signal transduction histidine kinase
VGISQDITERRNLEQQFLQAQKMEAVGRLAGGVAHDFNNLLTAIIGYCQLALDQIDPRASLYQDIKEAMRAGDRAAAVTRQLLSFSRKQFLQPRFVDVNAIVMDVERLLRRLIGEDIELATSLGKDLPSVLIDPGQLEQVIVNLSVNARDAMPHGGSLGIETSITELDAGYCRLHPETTPGPYLLLAITDSGTGMTEDVKAHLFEPFFTTKEVGKGTGLGLATVHGILKQSNGHINVYSELGRGTTFKIYLPVVGQQAPAVRRVEVTLGSLRGKESILLVEDDPHVRNLSAAILTRAGYQVQQARRGEEALALAEMPANMINLLLTDLVMPGMNGVVLARTLRSTRPDLQVLFTSGYTDSTLLKDGFFTPDTPFITKPFTPEALLRRVRELLDSKPGKTVP